MLRKSLALSKDYYKVLGVKKGASSEDVKKAYKKKAAQLHPDVNNSPDAGKAFSELNDAYETLKDSGKREYYHFTGSRPNSEQDMKGYEDLKKAKKRQETAERQYREHQQQYHNPFNEQYGNHEYDLNDKRWRRYEHNPWEDPFVDPFYASEYPGEMNFRPFDDVSGGHWKRNNMKSKKNKKKTAGKQQTPPSKNGKNPKQQRGADVATDLQISLDDVMRGCTKSITFKKKKQCWECNGKGVDSKRNPRVCGACEGAGAYILQQTPSRVYEVSCEECEGKGFFEKICRKCKGDGVLDVDHSVSTGLPPGLSTGCKVRIEGEGNSGTSGGAPGDLLITITTGNNHPRVIRGSDNSLNIPVTIPWSVSLLGGNAKLQTHTGEEIEIVIKPGTPHLSRIILPCEGLDVYPQGHELKIAPGKPTNLTRPGVTGKVYGYVVVVPPDVQKLTREEREVLKNLKNSQSKTVEQESAGFVKARFGGK